MKANEILIGSQRIDIQPDGAQAVTVYVTKWANDNKTLRIVMSSGERTGLNITWSNAGELLTVYQGTTATHTCTQGTATCNWEVANASSFTISVLDPIAAEQAANNAPPPLAAGGVSGGGGSSPPPPASTRRTSGFLSDVPSLPALIPKLSTGEWAALGIGFILFFNGIRPTRAVMPPMLRLPYPPLALLAAGALVLGYIWLRGGSA